ncbi:MAG: MucR family transcriptional regulator [Pelagibacterium sp. SCN 64-44]|nr:MAG: MucR family transcriptional regulator [Pelagibacterium sp. SCN 64-44]
MSDTANTSDHYILELTTEVVAAYVGKNAVSAGDLPKLITDTHAALTQLQPGDVVEPVIELTPAVSIKKSITPEFLICLEDGLKFKSLKRHLATHHQLTPEQYREKWSLPLDYPIVAPSYSATRSALAKANGLGRKLEEPAAATAPAKTTRKKLGLKF